jgi:hypothetical protein
MGLGVLADRHLEHVPGTSVLSERGDLQADAEAFDGVDARRLKHDASGKVVLVPQVFFSPMLANFSLRTLQMIH